jgi:GH15 family glucan-1,4-alpha-glucosidase
MCWPKFDSSFIFGNLLDHDHGGHFYIKPNHKDFSTEQYYITNTNILCTEFTAPDGRFRVTDFAPRFYQYERHFRPLMLFRKVEPLEGNPQIVVCCEPVGDYGNVKPESYIGSNHIRYLGLKKPVRLTTGLPLSYVMSKRPIFLNQTNYLCLSWGIPLEAPLESTAEDFLRNTREYWQNFINEAAIANFRQKSIQLGLSLLLAAGLLLYADGAEQHRALLRAAAVRFLHPEPAKPEKRTGGPTPGLYPGR